MFFRFLLCRTTFYIVRCSLKPVCVVACMDTTPLPAHMIDACLYIVQNGIINNLIQRALYILWTMEPIVVIAENSLISQKGILSTHHDVGLAWVVLFAGESIAHFQLENFINTNISCM
ncbi:uncharacterized protein LOC130779210 isoform X4 [Actinidia eriantha]|uniref:uncharacterized protein LOC130779210 isoform X4 n=1 Tax=Actinidia eriantha TaxID=165200 RepID=UPI00258DCABD|nr:uncharacterized protein LOC130779210 isoform X4 [Actinidia eriantha]